METITLGSSGIEVSRLCIGAWQAAGWSSSDDDRFVEVVQHAMDRGLNFIDTAEGYGGGRSEELVARALGPRRDHMVVATKVGPSHAAPDDLGQALDASLQRLQTDHVNLYQYHWPSPDVPLAETLGAMEEQRRAGKIRAIGVSNWLAPEWDEFDDPARIDALQPCHSLLWRSAETAAIPTCRAHNIAVIPYSPLCQGALAGRFRSMDDVPDQRDPRRKNKVWRQEKLPGVLAVIDKLEEIGQKYDKTMAQTALRWLLDQPGVTAPIVGASRVAQVDDNLGALNWHLDADDWAALDEISRPLSADLTPQDTLWGWHPK